jgi:hypothetical protein
MRFRIFFVIYVTVSRSDAVCVIGLIAIVPVYY